MAIEMASKGGAWFYDITVAKQQCCGQLKIKPSYNIVRYYVFIKIYCRLAIIVGGGRGIVVIDREAVEIKHFLL
jgi:hypothetical protein